GNVMGQVSVRVSPAWTAGAKYWCDSSDIGPVYLGFEYGIRNTGLFVFFRDDGATGTIVVGGPLHANSNPRPAQAEYVVGWKSHPGDVFTFFFEADSPSQSMRLWLDISDGTGPHIVDSFPFGTLSPFEPPTSSFSNKRE